MQIRKVKREDLVEVAKIKVEAWQDSYKGIVDNNYLNNMDYKRTAEKWEKNFNDENFIVAIVDNQIVGFCRYGDRIDELERFIEYDGEIYAIYIKSDYKRRGIGRKFVNYAIQDLKKQGKKKVIIWCLEQNKGAKKFYSSINGKYLGEKDANIGNTIYKEIAYGYKV